jgi:hypothetical protein
MRLKGMFQKLKNDHQTLIQNQNPSINGMKEKMNEAFLHSLFEKCKDVKFQSVHVNEHSLQLIFCEGMINSDEFNSVILVKLENFLHQQQKLSAEVIQQGLLVPGLQPIENTEKVVSEVFSGKLLLFFSQPELTFSTDIAKMPRRKPEESKTEAAIKGPRDNFIEDLTVNVSLIRKRLRTNTLCYEQYEVGRRTHTRIGVLYINDIANQEILKQIKEKLNAIDVDGLYSGIQINEFLNDTPFAFIPRYQYTGRPEFAVQGLLSGRFIILIDGVPYAIIIPSNLGLMLKTAEDTETSFLYNSFERLMRVVGLSISTFLPGFWVALTAFHQNQIPMTFLATIVESRRGVPLPSGLEAFLMIFLFELFREAGMRLPLAIGQTLSVVGGLIIGDAAIRAGLTNPSMLVVIGASTVATFTQGNQSVVGTISLLRIFVLFCSSILGLFGFFISLYIILFNVARIRTFGVPYLMEATRVNLINLLKTYFRLPAQKDLSRPKGLDPLDAAKQGRRK